MNTARQYHTLTAHHARMLATGLVLFASTAAAVATAL